VKQSKIITILGLVIVLALFSLVAVAQDTEQSENECYEGGWLEGRCSTTDADVDGDVDQFDIDWMFTCGFYLSQVDDAIAITNQEIPLEGCEKQEREIPRPEEKPEDDDEEEKVVVTPL